MNKGAITLAGSWACCLACAALAAHCGSSPGSGGGTPDGATADSTTDSGEGQDSAEESLGPDASDGGPGMDGLPGMDGSVASDAAGEAAAMQRGCPADAGTGCFTVYAHTGTDLYYLDLTSASLVAVGSFDALKPDGGGTDVITDLAVSPDDALWVVSATALYRADASNGHATLVGPIAKCGSGNVALTADGTGALFLGDFEGTVCGLDPSTTPPTVAAAVSLSGGFALAGDLAVAGSTMYGTIYSVATPTTIQDNWLATIDPLSGVTTALPSATGYPKLFGLAYGGHHALGFTADGSGRVVSIDPSSGVGMVYATFTGDAGTGLVFAGAGVNPRVSP